MLEEIYSKGKRPKKRKTSAKIIHIGAKVTKAMKDKIKEMKIAEDRSESYIINKALEYFFSHQSIKK